MKLVIDLQGAQTTSRWRGIGRYSLALAKHIAMLAEEHEIIVVLNDAFPETIKPLRREFAPYLPEQNVKVWSGPRHIVGADPATSARRHLAEVLYESFLANLKPDAILITSLFEGMDDGYASSVHRLSHKIPTAVICYDFIPLHDPDRYLTQHAFPKPLYMEKLEYLKSANLILAISEHTATEANERVSGSNGKIVNISAACSDVFQSSNMSTSDRNDLKSRLGIDRDFVVTSGGLDPHKNLITLFNAFSALPENIRSAHQIVLVGNNDQAQRKELRQKAATCGLKADELIFSRFVTDEELVALYSDAVLMVFPSTDEGFGLPPLEAMSCGTPAIASNASSLPEVIGLPSALFDPFDVPALSTLMQSALTDVTFRDELSTHAEKQAKLFSWEKTADTALREIERLHATSVPLCTNSYSALNDCLETLSKLRPAKSEVDALARNLAFNFPAPGRKRRLFVDITTLQVHDARTGCQRVARSVLMEWLNNPPEGIEICPVYAKSETAAFFHANEYVEKLTGVSRDANDLPIDYAQGDIFFGLDLHAHISDINVAFLRQIHSRGVRVLFMVYDLLPLEMPSFFVDPLREAFEKWVAIITAFDGVIGISQSSADAVHTWVSRNQSAEADDTFEYHAVHLGADIENSVPTSGLPADANHVLDVIRSGPSFLMTGTLEPRKGQEHALDAFEQVWSKGKDYRLVIVGKEGWHIEEFAQRLRNHPELGNRLFWLEGVSDEYLTEIYQSASCLLAASWGEGFGLPIIEAARENLPILARDLPVFREVAGDHARYFDTTSADVLADAIISWQNEFEAGTVPASENIPWLTWAECADKLAQKLIAT